MRLHGESKIEATHRLQRDGRWGIASRFRDHERLRLRDEGKSRRDAREAAWERMIDRFRPIDESAHSWPQFVAGCPPLLRHPQKQPALNAVWDSIWLVVSFVAEGDAVLRRSMAECNADSTDLLWQLCQELPEDVRVRLTELCPSTCRSLGDVMFPEPEPLVHWAEPILLDALEITEPEKVIGEYAAVSIQFLESLVASLPTLRDSIRWFWPEIKPRAGA